jgi:PAS domain S-box-containing protein
MTVEKPVTGSDDLLPENGSSADNHTLNKERSIQQSDLRALIQSRKENEKQLSLRLTLVQAVLEGADNAIFSVDTQYRYSSFNKKHAGDMEDLYGCTIKIWEKLAGFVPVEKDRQKILRLVQQALAGERGTFGHYLGDSTRKRRYFDLSFYPVRDDAGTILGAAVIAKDTTDRKESEDRLSSRFSRLQKIIEGADIAIFSVDAQCCYTSFNKKHAGDMKALYGSTVKDGKNLAEFVPIEKDRQKILRLVRQALAGEQAALKDYFGDNARSRRYFDLASYPLADDTGLITGAAVISADCTLEKQAEKALIDQEDQYHRLVDNAPDLIFRVSIPGGAYEYFSPASLAFTGYTPEEFYEKPGLLYELVHHAWKDAFGRQMEILSKGRSPPVSEFQIVHKNGDVRWWFFRTSVIQDAGGHPVAYEGIVTDVTDRKLEEIALVETNEKFRTIVQSSDTGIILVDAMTQVITDANPRALEMIGGSRNEVIGAVCHRFFCPSQTDTCPVTGPKERQNASEGTLITTGEKRIPVLRTVAATTISGREMLIESFTDLSEQKKTENCLRESGERYRAFIATSSDGVFRFELDPAVPVNIPAAEQIARFIDQGILAECNDAMARMYGYERSDEIVGQKIGGFMDAGEPRTLECLQKFVRDGYHVEDFETEEHDREGKPRWFTCTMNGILRDNGIVCLWGVRREITDRRKAELILRKSKGRFRELSEQSIDIICTLTVSGEIRSINPAVSTHLGYLPDEVIGNNILDYLNPEMQQRLLEEIEKIRNGARSDRFLEIEIRTKDGRSIPFEVNVRIRTYGDGNPEIVVIAREISERKRIENALRESEERFRALIQNSPDIIQILDREKQLVYSSPSFSKLLGYPDGSRHSGCIPDLVHPEDRDRVAADLEEVYTRTNPQTPTGYRMLTADGNFLYVESVGVNLLGVPGVDGVVITTHIVHEQKQAEQVLQEREERFRLIFQHSNDAVYFFEITPAGMPGKIVDANDAALRQSGYSKAELVHKNLPDICSRDLTRRSRAIMMELLTRGEARFETETIRKDGALLPVEISARPVKLQDKTYVIAISRDISQRLREDRSLRIANQKLQLMTIVSWHDIQNKVTALRGYVARSKDLATDEKLKKFIDSQEDILKVIHRQLQYTKDYQEMGIHPPRWVNLPQVLRTIISFRQLGSLACRMDIDNLELYCDPVIEKVFSHLIENTQNHAQTAAEIRISCQKTPDGLTILYEDDGIGIPSEKKKDLFIQGAGTATGVSLFFVHDILEICEMTIRETGEPGSGVRFEISVPKGLYRIGRNEA